MAEAPLISKALRLVSLALIVSTVALVASAGYSGYQEYTALSGAFSSIASSGTTTNSSSPSHFSEQFNGTNLIISGLEIPNNMSYPLNVRVSGVVDLAGSTVGNFTTPMEHIAPGEAQPISLDAALDFQRALSNQSALESLLFSSSTLTFETTIYADVVPLINLNMTSSSNTTLPAVLSNFNITPSTPSCTSQGCTVPIGIAWSNPSPIGFGGNLTVAVTKIPGAAGGSPLPNATIPMDVVAGSPGAETANLFFPSGETSLQNLSPGTVVDLGITFRAFGANATIPESLVIS